jgi:hypothetical protein
VRIFLLFFIACHIATAAVADTAYSVVGAGCVPTGQTTASSVSLNTAGDAKFSGSKTGEIVLTCPIPMLSLSATSFAVVYRDTDGQRTGAQVTATLRRKSILTAEVSDVGQAKLDSNNFEVTTGYRTMSTNIGTTGCGEYIYDQNQYVYYVQVVLRRTSTAHEPILAIVRLSTRVC